jgi:hypothetical protein
MCLNGIEEKWRRFLLHFSRLLFHQFLSSNSVQFLEAGKRQLFS